MVTDNFTNKGAVIYDPKIYDKVNPDVGEDLEFYYNLVKEKGGKVLELCYC